MEINKILVDRTMRELQTHGTADFPVQVYLDDFAKYDIGYVRWHWHQEIELAVVETGFVEWHINNRRIVLGQGEGIFINSQVLHSARSAHGTRAVMYSVLFNPSVVARSSGLIYSKYVIPILNDGELPYVVLGKLKEWESHTASLIRKIVDYDAAGEFAYELDIANSLSALWLQILRNSKGPAQGREQDVHAVRMKHMLAFIHENYHRGINLTQIADAASISKSECQRCFTKTLGVSPVDYLIGYRLEMAAGMLRNQELTVSEAACRCGFSNISYFGKRFKDIYGKTPREYRMAAPSSPDKTL